MLCASLRSFHDFGIDAPVQTASIRAWPLSKKQRPRGVFSRGHPWVGELFCFGVSDSHPEPSASQTQNGTRFSRTDHDLSTVFAVNTCGKSNNVFMSSVQTDSKGHELRNKMCLVSNYPLDTTGTPASERVTQEFRQEDL